MGHSVPWPVLAKPIHSPNRTVLSGPIGPSGAAYRSTGPLSGWTGGYVRAVDARRTAAIARALNVRPASPSMRQGIPALMKVSRRGRPLATGEPEMAYGDGGDPVTVWTRGNGAGGGLDIVRSVSDPRKEVREAIAGTAVWPFREALADGGVEDTRTLEEIGDARRAVGDAYAGAGFGEVPAPPRGRRGTPRRGDPRGRR